jgi:hypothetical protein
MPSSGSGSVVARFFLGLVAGAAIAVGVGLVLQVSLPWLAALIGLSALWGAGMSAVGAYSLGVLPVIGLVLDLSWSLPNTVISVVWLIACVARGSLQPPTADSQRSGTLVIAGAAMPGAGATTLGNVIGGVWYAHEDVHVWQARLFGPLYWPIYLLSYVLNMLARFVTLRFGDPHWQACGRDVMEDWAEGACPVAAPGGPSRDVNWGWWLLGLLMAAIFGAGILIVTIGAGWLAVPLPNPGLVGALAALAVMFLFALIRSYFPRIA